MKDEWEVARLFSTWEFQRALDQEFEGPYRLHFHIGAWPFARPDPQTGVIGKGEAGPWMMTAFRAMARLRFLRGTWLDPFRNSDERKLERRLIAEFEADVGDFLRAYPPTTHPTAVRLLGPSRDDQGLRAGEGSERGGRGQGARHGAPPAECGEDTDGDCGMTVKGKTIVVTGAFGALGGGRRSGGEAGGVGGRARLSPRRRRRACTIGSGRTRCLSAKSISFRPRRPGRRWTRSRGGSAGSTPS